MFHLKHHEMIKFLQKNILLKHLSNDQLQILSQLFEEVHYPANTFIINEGEFSKDLYIIADGEVDILNKHHETEESFAIGHLTKKDIFGEMAFIDDAPRSSSIVTTTPVIVLKLSKTVLENHDENMRMIYNQIIINISRINASRLRTTSKSYAQALCIERDQLRLRNEFGRLFIVIIICFGISNIADIVAFHYFGNIPPLLFTWSYLITLLLPMVYFIKKYSYSLKTFGVGFTQFLPALSLGLIVSASMVIITFIVLYILDSISHASHVKNMLMQLKVILTPSLLLYFFHAYIQEFIARGVLQTSLQRFYDDTRGFYSVLITSLLFGIFHIHISVRFAAVTFIASIFFGLIYNYRKNLIGVALIHFVLGIIAKSLHLM